MGQVELVWSFSSVLQDLQDLVSHVNDQATAHVMTGCIAHSMSSHVVSAAAVRVDWVSCQLIVFRRQRSSPKWQITSKPWGVLYIQQS